MEFYRIKRLPPYVFEEVNILKAQARARGEDVIDMGMGNPDMPTPSHIVDKLVETVKKPRTNRYSASRGIAGLRRALAAYYERRFGVFLDHEREVIVTIGSKEGFANMAQAISTPGDVFLVPDPSYPLHTFGFIISEASIRHVPVGGGAGKDFLSSIAQIAQKCTPSPRAVIVNFPSNPTAQTVTLDFYKELLAIAERYDMYILSDLAYAEIYFTEEPPPSVLELSGARKRVVEFTSMSKTYAMPGWRIGFAVGCERLVAALGRIKSYVDYGAFTPIQVAAATALNGSQACVEEIRDTYRRRRDVLVESMGQAGWEIPAPPATMFAWAPLPPALAHMGSLEFAKLLLREAHLAVSPGIGFGKGGEGFVRMSLVENQQRIRQAARNVRRVLLGREG